MITQKKPFKLLHYYFYVSAYKHRTSYFSKVTLVGNPEQMLEFITCCVLWSRWLTSLCCSFFIMSENKLKLAYVFFLGNN